MRERGSCQAGEDSADAAAAVGETMEKTPPLPLLWRFRNERLQKYAFCLRHVCPYVTTVKIQDADITTF